MKLDPKEREHLVRKLSRAYYRACKDPSCTTKVSLYHKELADLRELLSIYHSGETNARMEGYNEHI